MSATDPSFLAGGKLEVTAIFIAPENPAINGIVGLLCQMNGANGFGGGNKRSPFPTCRRKSWHIFNCDRFDHIVFIPWEVESYFSIGVH